MNSSRSALDCLQEAVLLSHRMLELSEQEDWQAMEALDRERMQWLEQAFTQGFAAEETAQARLLAEEVQQLNQQAMHKAQAALADVKQSARDLQRNLQAARAYLENTEEAQQNR